MSAPRPSILEIARRAGVSPATVSRAFSQPALVRGETLARIHEVAQALDFRPNRVGSSLRSGRTRTLGLILPTLANPVFAQCLEGAEQHARAAGYSVMVTTTHYDPEREASAVQRLIDHQVDALILTVADAANSDCLAAVKQAGLPYVLAYNESRHHPFVSVDNQAAAGDVISALAELGHQRIAFVTGPLSSSDRARSRLLGARARARKLCLPAPLHLTLAAHTASSAAALLAALRLPGAPTALFCSNDLLAAAVIADLVGSGLSVPRDISVCGFDGMSFGSLMVPPLSSLEQPNEAIGARACAHLLARLDGDGAAALALRLPHRILPGGTMAAVRPSPVPQQRPTS
jgi:LacI family repressor for deo operon, udp, cdd, tsx, nupC, and nupG